jgi:uncharacterized protein
MIDKKATSVKGVVPYLRLPVGAEPYLEGMRCSNCGATYLGSRAACGKCFAVGSLAATRLSNSGTLYNYTIVHRSFPGIKTPFVSATVDLDDGVTIRGNLVDIVPDPERIRFGMPVRVVFRDCGLTDASGAVFISHFFTPAEINLP